MRYFLAKHFKRQLKKISKKHPHIKEDLKGALQKFDPTHSVRIGGSIYKIRIGSRDLVKGKSGGFRCYIYLYQKEPLLAPLCIYLKSNRELISEDELQNSLDAINNELINFFGNPK